MTDITERLDKAVAGVEGVVELYAPRPSIGMLWRQAVDGDSALVATGTDADGVWAEASVGIAHDAGAHEVARAVVDVVRAALGDPRARVTVRIGRVIFGAARPSTDHPSAPPEDEPQEIPKTR